MACILKASISILHTYVSQPILRLQRRLKRKLTEFVLALSGILNKEPDWTKVQLKLFKTPLGYVNWVYAKLENNDLENKIHTVSKESSFAYVMFY